MSSRAANIDLVSRFLEAFKFLGGFDMCDGLGSAKWNLLQIQIWKQGVHPG